MRARALLLAMALGSALPRSAAAGGGKFRLNEGDRPSRLIVFGIGTAAGAEFLRWRGYPEWKAVLLSAILCNGAGLVKEYALDPEPARGDMVANGIGAGLGAGLWLTYRF